MKDPEEAARMEETTDNIPHEVKTNAFSRATFAFLNNLFELGKAKPLQLKDLYGLESKNRAKTISEEFERAWESMKVAHGNKDPQLLMMRAAFKAFGRDFYLSGLYLFLYNINGFATPLLIRTLLVWLESPDSQSWYPYTVVVAIFVMQVIASFTYNYQFELAAKTGFRFRTGVSQLLFQKYFKLSNATRQLYSIGKIVNLSSTDCLKIDLACQYFHMMWCSIILIIGSFIILYLYLGVAAFAGFAVILIYIPIQFYFSKANAAFRRKAFVFSDKRMKIIQESLKGIRVIKSYSWEKSFLKVVGALREQECKFVYYFLAARATTSSITQGVPTIAMVLTFIVYFYLGNTLSVALVIPSLALFYCLRVPMLFMPVAIAYSIDAWISFNRIGTFLLSSELVRTNSKPVILISDAAVEIVDGEFEWDSDATDTEAKKLEQINLNIPKGRLVAIVGQVASGKSSIIQALLGDMKKSKGYISVNGSIGYCPQQPWITNSTIQENIIFGLPYDSEKLSKVIAACSLERDIASMDGGSMAEIGENGINLSGGQKARLSLARACYSDADIYLLDDPLSAVDSRVGKHLFDECINGFLGDKTRILVTHQLHVLEQVDTIIVMEGCRILAQGTYDELYKSSHHFTTLMNSYNRITDEEVAAENEARRALIRSKLNISGVKQEEDDVHSPFQTSKTRLILEEEQAVGAVSFEVFKEYVMAAGGLLFVSLLFLFISTSNIARVLTDQWLLYWSTNKYPLTWQVYVGLYLFLAVSQIIFAVFYGLSTAFFGARASRQLHDSALGKVYASPISFFDSTPLGRITSRFSRDTDTLDSLLPEAIRGFTWTLLMCIANLVVIAVFIPYFLVAIALAFFFYYYFQNTYRSTARELRRIDSITRSPVIAMLTESLTGISTIRAFDAVDQFVSRNLTLLDSNNQAQYLVLLTQRWIQLRLDILNSVLVLLTSVIAVALNNQLNPGLTGLLIAYSLQITQTFSWTIKTGTDVETFFNCAERLVYYMRELPSERPYDVGFAPSKQWPEHGSISVSSICLRYRPDLPLVLHRVSFEVKAAEKVGICGRTGAGKSTILSAFLRLIELESGSISIDGVEISHLGLGNLRSRLAIIPQEPVLFSGTLRFNLDPFAEYQDEELWNVLERANLSQMVAQMPDRLESMISEGGENWSVGQRQLICLARAMLRKSKVILLDEATASVDFETDEAIQKAIRIDFADCTVITIAHRLNTIADYDRVLVLSHGEVVEFDSPSNLLSKKSDFAKMVRETGAQNEAIIRMIASSTQTFST